MQIEVDWLVPGGNYHIELEKVSNGCTSARDTMVLVSQPFPELGNDVSICDGDSIIFSLQDDYLVYEWQDNSDDPEYTAKDRRSCPGESYRSIHLRRIGYGNGDRSPQSND